MRCPALFRITAAGHPEPLLRQSIVVEKVERNAVQHRLMRANYLLEVLPQDRHASFDCPLTIKLRMTPES